MRPSAPAVLADGIQHDMPLTFGHDLAQDINAFGLQPLQIDRYSHTAVRCNPWSAEGKAHAELKFQFESRWTPFSHYR